MQRAWLKSRLFAMGGFIAFLLGWEVVGRMGMLGGSLPPLTNVLGTIQDPVLSRVLFQALAVTLTRAAIGYGIGVAVATVLAVGVVLFPRAEPGVLRLAVVINSIPIIAIGPLMISTAPRDWTPSFIAAFAVFFSTLVAVVAGLSRGSAVHYDLFAVFGSSKLTRLSRLQLPGAVPMLVDALKVGVPTAMVGTILGEWFGVEDGIGPILVTAMDNYRINLLWSAALLASMSSIAIYGLLAICERFAVARYSRTIAVKGVQESFEEDANTSGLSGSLPGRLLRWPLRFWAVGLALLLWQLWTSIGSVENIVLPGPGPVIMDISLNPAIYAPHVLHTVGVAVIGLTASLIAGTVLAVLVASSSVLGGLITPFTVIIRAVPVVAMIPVIARMLGYSDTTVVAVAAVIPFFPTFVLALSGLRSRPPGADDVFAVLSASRWVALWRLHLPSAVPNLLVSLRIAAATAFLAALAAEWLIGVKGLGYLMGETRSVFAVNRAWGAVVLATALSVMAFLTTDWLGRQGRRRWS